MIETDQKNSYINFLTAVNAGALISLKDFNLLLQETYVYESIFKIFRKRDRVY